MPVQIESQQADYIGPALAAGSAVGSGVASATGSAAAATGTSSTATGALNGGDGYASLLPGSQEGNYLLGQFNDWAFDTKWKNDNRQRQQNQALLDQQEAENEKYGNYQFGQQQKWFDITNAYNLPSAQIKRLQDAGLNPALIYGGGTGQGGATMPTAGAPNSGGGSSAANAASTESNDISKTMMLESMKVMDSQAQLNNAQAAKISGVDTANVGADTTLKQKQQGKVDADTQYQQLISEYQKTTNEIQKATEPDQINQIIDNELSAFENKNILETNAKINNATYDEQVKRISLLNENLIQAILTSRAGANLDNKRADAISTELIQGWQKLQNERRGQDMNMQQAQMYVSNALKVAGIQAAGQVVNNVTSILMKRPPMNTTSTTENSNGDWSTTTMYHHK